MLRSAVAMPRACRSWKRLFANYVEMTKTK
jgi:hypothetical protein